MIDRVAGGKLHNKNADESWEIIENLALTTIEAVTNTKEFHHRRSGISTPQCLKLILVTTKPVPVSQAENPTYPYNLEINIMSPGHRTVAANYFFNNDLKYLKTSDPEGERRKLCTIISDKANLQAKCFTPTKGRVLGVKSVSVKKLHEYGHLEEIVVKISDQQLYKFKEGDFVDLHLNDIEDMLLLTVQHKLFHLDRNVIVDFIVALRMFTRSLILKRHVEDLQLGVESYQKKLNITKPQKTFPEIEFKKPHTPSYDPPGIVYEDLDKQKRVLRADELYKFSDGTLKSVRDEIHHRVLDFRLD
ncbi:hypothetical protein Tco_0647638 [Tanacetum coccineum]